MKSNYWVYLVDVAQPRDVGYHLGQFSDRHGVVEGRYVAASLARHGNLRGSQT